MYLPQAAHKASNDHRLETVLVKSPNEPRPNPSRYWRRALRLSPESASVPGPASQPGSAIAPVRLQDMGIAPGRSPSHSPPAATAPRSARLPSPTPVMKYVFSTPYCPSVNTVSGIGAATTSDSLTTDSIHHWSLRYIRCQLSRPHCGGGPRPATRTEPGYRRPQGSNERTARPNGASARCE